MSSLFELDWFPLWLSLRVALLSTALVLTLGTALSYLLAYRDFRGKEAVDLLATMPLVLPPTVLGYYLLVLLGRASPFGKLYEALVGQPLVFTWQAAVIASFFYSAPLYIKASRAAFESIDLRYRWAARSLGASEGKVFFQVILPLARRNLSAMTALCFARSLGDFGATMMLAGNIPGKTQTLSTAIYEAVESGNGHLARTFVIVTSAVALAVLWPANRFLRGPLTSPLH